MRRLLTFLIVLATIVLGVCSLASAQHSLVPGFPPGVYQNRAALDGAAAPSYQGPGDIVSGALAFYSCGRAYNAAYASANGNLCDLAAVTGGAAVCTLKALSTGYVNLTSSACTGGTQTPAAACAAASGGSCVVSKMYDQSGALDCTGGTACDVTNGTNTNRPAISFSALNSLPCVAYVSSNSTMSLSNVSGFAATHNMPFALTSVSLATNAARAATNDIIAVNSAAESISYRTTANTFGTQSGTITATASDGSFHALQGAFVSTSANASFVVVDGTKTSGTLTALSISGVIFVGNGSGGGGNTLNGTLCETGIWPSDFTSTFSSMNSNMHSATSGWNF